MKPEIKMMWSTPDAEYQIVRATRICYASEDSIDSRWVPTGEAQEILLSGNMTIGVPVLKVNIGPKDEDLLRTIMKNQHNTCLRFASAAFHIKDISRVCSHQLVRIAHFGILQRSQRYCNEGKSSFVFPESLDGLLNKDVYLENTLDIYNDLIESGVKEEDARYVLPGASSTQINMVANFQGWKHFLKIRLAKKVQLETRQVAAEVCRQLYAVAPIIFESDYNKLEELGL